MSIRVLAKDRPADIIRRVRDSLRAPTGGATPSVTLSFTLEPASYGDSVSAATLGVERS